MKPDAEGLNPIANTEKPDRKADIVFVHGLGGSSHGTWRYGKEGKPGHFFWPEQLAKDMPDCGIWTVDYPAGFTRLGAQGMIVEKRAGNLSDTLVNGGLGERPIIFITHSMGGLIVKHLIVDSLLSPSESRKQIVSWVRGVVFCGTPHKGSGFADAAKVYCVLGGGRQAHMKEMIANAENLTFLHGKFIEWHRYNPIAIVSYAENKKLKLIRWLLFPTNYGIVVPRASADPSIPGCEIHDSDDDHLTLVKPRNQQHNVYAGVLRFIVKTLNDSVSFVPKNVFAPIAARPLAAAPRRQVDVASVLIDISRIDKYAPCELIGREKELKELSDAWDLVVRGETRRPNIITIVALGGEGKTSLVAKWIADLGYNGWSGCEAVYAWSFYNQGMRYSTSSDLFFKEALTFFGDSVTARSNKNSLYKARCLARLVCARKVLLVLDGLESLQFSPASPTAGELKDQGVAVLLREIALSNKGLCVVTTRYAISDLRNYWQTTAPTKDLLRLSTSNGVKLLRSVGVTTGSNAEFEQLVEEVDGHALTLQIMGGFLARAFHGDVRYRDRIRFEKADKEIQGGHAYRAINAYVKWMKDGSAESRRELAILQVLGLFDRAATEDCLRAIFAAPIISGLTEPLVGMSNEDMELSITSLQRAKLVTVIRTSAGGLQVLDAHPIIKDFFACQLRDGPLYLSAFQKLIKRIFYSASSTRSAWIKAHRRIYKHLCSVTKESEKPSLEEILPLYQAIFHGCHAGLQQEACDAVYFGRILRERENYSTRKLGAFSSNIGAIACFFVRQWNFVSSALVEKDQNWILNEAATCLRALGRLTEAIDPYEIGLKNRVLQKQWIDAAGIANNLSELVLCLGATDKAIEVANSSVSYASTSKDVMRQIICKTTFADSLHQAGRLKEADDNFVSAEQLLIAHYHRYRFLAATMGFQYGELLLGGAECVVWKIVQDGASMSVGPEYGPACQSVVRRAKWSLQIAQGNRNPLDTAFDNLTLGRAMMYDMIIYHNKLSISRKVFAKGTAKAATIMSVISTAEDGFRLSGIITEMPRVLVTRALLRYLSGQLDGPDSSQRDLDEAVEIAQRGPMPMFMADIHLYRARLFFREEHYPWDKNPDGTTRGPKDDLIEARRLIEKHGYWRRKEELEDAERAIIMKK